MYNMKSSLAMMVAGGLLTSAFPFIDKRGRVDDMATDMQKVIDGETDCFNIAHLFARGTFDSGNVGVFVGPQFNDELNAALGSDIFFQGVDNEKYPADMTGYLQENGGSTDGAKAMADMATKYVEKCETATLILSGWSQGAVVLHKALGMMDESVLHQVGAVVTYGDPNIRWEKLPVPDIVKNVYIEECINEGAFDPLCVDFDDDDINVPDDWEPPEDISALKQLYKDLPSAVEGGQQAAQLAALVPKLLVQVAKNVGQFLNLLKTAPIRLMLTPQHFTYGNTQYVERAAKWVATRPKVKGALCSASQSQFASRGVVSGPSCNITFTPN